MELIQNRAERQTAMNTVMNLLVL